MQVESLFAEAFGVGSTQQSPKKPEIPEEFICRISMQIMKDPVSTPSGFSYEREYLLEHLRTGNMIDPVTREKCGFEDIRPNNYLKKAIERFLEQNPWAYFE